MPGVLCPIVVGRTAETARLDAALAAAAAGAGSLVVVTGEPGVGKSRLTRELAVAARASGVGVVAGRAVAAGRHTPYRPLAEALAQALRHRGLPDHAELRPWLPALAALLPLGVPADGRGEESAVVRGEAVVRLLHRLAEPAALLVVLEDLHWADPDTLAIVEYLGDNLSGSRVLCMATMRTEPRTVAAELLDRLASRRAALTVPLARLGHDDIGAMIRACAPEADSALIERVAAAAEGVPFLVEELLASPGVPVSFAETVRARLTELGPELTGVVEAAAVLGRHFDWRLLAAATGRSQSDVDAALETGAASLLLANDGDRYRFRHALTREAVVDMLPPGRRAMLAAAALDAVEGAHPGLPGGWGDVAADLAAQAGDRARAGALFLAAGQAAFDRGAVATAVDTLRRALAVAGEPGVGVEAGCLLVEALALAGRVDEAVAAGDIMIANLSTAGARAELHLTLAHAAVAAARWPLASRHLDEAERLAEPSPRSLVLRAELAIKADDLSGALERAQAALAAPDCPDPVRCYALELVGRTHRLHNLDAAREAFEEGLRMSTNAGLPVWRLRALHELGTVEMFDHAGTARLAEARRAADELGVLSTGAVLDMHLAAAFLFRFDFEAALRHALAAAATSERLHLDRLRGLSFMFVGQIHAMRLEREEMERALIQAAAAAPGDAEIEGSGWAGGRGMIALLEGNRPAAMEALGRGVAMLRTIPTSGPACYRGLYPLLLAVTGDAMATAAIAEARDLGMGVNRGNRGMLAFADAVLAGRRGDQELAAALAARAEADLAHIGGWGDIARLHAAEAALADGWGEPAVWLAIAAASFERLGLSALVIQCATLAGGRPPSRLDRWGVTERERDVLCLVVEGHSNKEIAARLALSPRTVEKHVESLLRKTGARSRTQLVAVAATERR